MKSKLLALALLLAIPGVASAKVNWHGEAGVPALKKSYIHLAAKAKGRGETTPEQRACLKRAANPHDCGVASPVSTKPTGSQAVPPKQQR